MKFLVIDDSVTMRRIIVNSLHRVGQNAVVEAVDGEDALAKFDDTISFVISDWNMPRMSGLDFARNLRARSDGATVPLLMITTRASREDIVAAATAGVSAYILKPFTHEVFADKLKTMLAAVSGAEPAAS